MSSRSRPRTVLALAVTSTPALMLPPAGAWSCLLADRPKVAAYVPNRDFRAAGPSGKARITRTGLGRYSMRLPNAPLGGAAQVTAQGTGKARCTISSIRRSGLPRRIRVRCFRADGPARADATFSLSFEK